MGSLDATRVRRGYPGPGPAQNGRMRGAVSGLTVHPPKKSQRCDTTALAIVPIEADEGTGVDIFAVASELQKRGWNMFTSQNPSCMSVCVGERFVGALFESWVADLREVLAYLRANPGTKPEGDAAVYGAAKALPDAILQDVMRSYCDVKMTVKAKA